MLRWLILLTAAMAASIASPVAAAPLAPQEMTLSLKGYVGDNAGVLSPAFIAELNRRLAAIHKRGEVTVVMVTAPPLGTPDPHRVARAMGELMRQSGKTNRDWAVFLLVPASRELGIAFSTRNQEAANAVKGMDEGSRDAFIQELGSAFSDAMTPYLQADDWQGGLRAGVDALEGRLDQGRPPPSDDPPPAQDSTS